LRPSVASTVAALAIALGPGVTGATAAGVPSPCPGDQGDPTTSGWALSTTTSDNAYTRHAYVGNGYLSQRVPATGTGYVETTQKTGWPLYTNAYDGAYVAGLYSTQPDPVMSPHDAAIAAIPTWSTLKVGTGSDTYSAATPAAQISTSARRCSSAAACCAPRSPGRRARGAPRTSCTTSSPRATTRMWAPCGSR